MADFMEYVILILIIVFVFKMCIVGTEGGGRL
jgi:hypothetical protein